MFLEALGISAGACIAVVGAGGKTTLCWRLVQELASLGQRAIFTTTTKIWQPPAQRGLAARAHHSHARTGGNL
jgi:probable selenium-dependent hydroxylase accessory protein YqeC